MITAGSKADCGAPRATTAGALCGSKNNFGDILIGFAARLAVGSLPIDAIWRGGGTYYTKAENKKIGKEASAFILDK